MQYCAPEQLDNYVETGSCYDKTILEKIARSYNRNFPKRPIKNIDSLTFQQLWKTLQKKMNRDCGEDEVCWVSRVGLDYDQKIGEYLRPKAPANWRKDPHTWLTNFNIEAVMFQYEASNPSYKFLGVFPVDFRGKDSHNQCLYEETCKINIKELHEQGVSFVGMIINLDKHDEPGSHWTSLFVCINPEYKCFGAYYYDSVGSPAPPEMKNFMKDLQTQAEKYRKGLHLKRRFRVEESKEQHQNGNTECGVFSMYYQIRWMYELKKNPKTMFADIVKPAVTDGQVFQLRKILFRPLYQFNS